MCTVRRLPGHRGRGLRGRGRYSPTAPVPCCRNGLSQASGHRCDTCWLLGGGTRRAGPRRAERSGAGGAGRSAAGGDARAAPGAGHGGAGRPLSSGGAAVEAAPRPPSSFSSFLLFPLLLLLHPPPRHFQGRLVTCGWRPGRAARGRSGSERRREQPRRAEPSLLR